MLPDILEWLCSLPGRICRVFATGLADEKIRHHVLENTIHSAADAAMDKALNKNESASDGEYLHETLLRQFDIKFASLASAAWAIAIMVAIIVYAVVFGRFSIDRAAASNLLAWGVMMYFMAFFPAVVLGYSRGLLLRIRPRWTGGFLCLMLIIALATLSNTFFGHYVFPQLLIGT